MRVLRQIGSLAFVAGLFVTIFAGVPWSVITYEDPVVPGWLRAAIFCLLGGILLVLLTLAAEQGVSKPPAESPPAEASAVDVLLSNTPEIPGRPVTESLGLVQGQTVYAIWIGQDLSAIVRLVLGGELTEYTEMMAKARSVALDRMVVQAAEIGADAVINVRYMTTSVVGSAAELLVYGTAVKLG